MGVDGSLSKVKALRLNGPLVTDSSKRLNPTPEYYGSQNIIVKRIEITILYPMLCSGEFIQLLDTRTHTVDMHMMS